jgi:hypothetical protein
MPHKTKLAQVDPHDKRVRKMVVMLRELSGIEGGPDASYEARRDAAHRVMAEIQWQAEERELKALVTTAEEVEIEGQRYRRLEQSSSATYFTPWGSHDVEEPLYRLLGVHNGPTVKPIELRAGIVEHMTPDLARRAGALSAHGSSREVEEVLKAVDLVPPSRAFIEKRVKRLARQVAAQVESLEEAARAAEPPPAQVASVSCGLDRMAVRMSEPLDAEAGEPPAPFRSKPYERTPPPPKEHNWRMARVGSTTAYDARGEPVHTWRYALPADADGKELARRVSAEVAWLLREHPGVPVHCIQDASPELDVLPKMLAEQLPANTTVCELVDFEHLMGYLESVVDACEPAGDPHHMKLWYRLELLDKDDAIDRVVRKLRRLAKTLPRQRTEARQAVADALRYIRHRKKKMRYASHAANHLPVGSGATESTCWEMQRRVKRPGQSWEPPGLGGILTIRGLVLSDRWSAAWNSYAATHRAEVRRAA